MTSRVRVSPYIKYKYSVNDFIKNRELGFRGKSLKLGYEDDFVLRFYNRLDTNENYKVNPPNPDRKYGGVFNLEFNLDGRLLGAACEEKAILIYDASNQRQIHALDNAHTDCVNCIRFLDDHTFASCSDDTSIKLWDLRNLNSELRIFYGHTNWVKNIEYSKAEGLLVTSAFDGGIYTWNTRGHFDDSRLYHKVFQLDGIMRTKLTADSSKMIISTTRGYIIIIHDLHLQTLANDLKSFKPNLYRLMQLTQQNFPAGNIFNSLFHPTRKRNRVEFIDDFPNNAEVISSLQIHPHSWTAVSRNTNADETNAWTCVHDIEARATGASRGVIVAYEKALEEELEQGSNRRPTDLWMGQVPVSQYLNNHTPFDEHSPLMRTINSGLVGRNTYTPIHPQNPEYKNLIMKNYPRMTHYIEEKTAGKGFIKEVCFSPDGRVICSPNETGIRLLGFNADYQELCYCVPDKPRELATLVSYHSYHKNVVVCCKFSPTHMQLVSGCLGGDIMWYQPMLN